MPTFEQFVAALRDPSLRSGIGLVIDDADANALLTRQDWAGAYYHRWISLFPPAPVAVTAPAPSPASAPSSASPQEAQGIFVAVRRDSDGRSHVTWSDNARRRVGVPRLLMLILIPAGALVVLMVVGFLSSR